MVEVQGVLTPVITEKHLRYPGPENRLFPLFWPSIAQMLFYKDQSQDALGVSVVLKNLPPNEGFLFRKSSFIKQTYKSIWQSKQYPLYYKTLANASCALATPGCGWLRGGGKEQLRWGERSCGKGSAATIEPREMDSMLKVSSSTKVGNIYFQFLPYPFKNTS